MAGAWSESRFCGERAATACSDDGFVVSIRRKKSDDCVSLGILMREGASSRFDPSRLPVIQVDTNAVNNLDDLFVVDRLIADWTDIKKTSFTVDDNILTADIGNGNEENGLSFIMQMVDGCSLNIRVFILPHSHIDFSVSLDGASQIISDVLGVRIPDDPDRQELLPIRQPISYEEKFLDQPMAERAATDRSAIRAMVEDFWRSFLAVGRHNPDVGRETIMRFEERLSATAALMPPAQSATFLRVVDEEREVLFQEYERNPDALKRRLGLGQNDAVVCVQHRGGGHRQQSLGDVAVRTAVRATVWESVRELFRLFR